MREKRRTKPIEISRKSLALRELTSDEFVMPYAEQTQFRVAAGRDIGGATDFGSRHADKLGRLGIGWPRLARNGTDRPGNLVRTNPKIQLQLGSSQGIASDGFVPPPAIEPNDDMWHLEKPVEFMSAPIRECDGSSCQNLLFRVGHRGRIVLETCLTRPAQLRPRRQARNQDAGFAYAR